MIYCVIYIEQSLKVLTFNST